jgi:hypothetical protein
MVKVIAAFRRRPVRVYLYGLLFPGFALAIAYGLTTADKAALWIALGGGVLVVSGGELAQRKTTPVADPRTTDGKPAYLATDTLPEPDVERWT